MDHITSNSKMRLHDLLMLTLSICMSCMAFCDADFILYIPTRQDMMKELNQEIRKGSVDINKICKDSEI